MDLNSLRRVSSAGYRLPERSNGTRPAKSQSPTNRTRHIEEDTESVEKNPDKKDLVKQDQLWKDLVLDERRAIRKWETNWSFLTNYDQLGQLKPEEPLPTYVSFYSDSIPITANNVYGSRLSTPLGRELVKLDRLTLSCGSHHRRRQDPEMLAL